MLSEQELNSEPTIGLVILVAPDDPIPLCLDSQLVLDEILVFTWDPRQARLIAEKDVSVHLIEETLYVEPIRFLMQSKLRTDWVLVLDPDETFEKGAISSFRSLVSNAHDSTAGYWVPYKMLLKGEELKHSFPNIKQLRLFRRNRIEYSDAIHASPTPIDGIFEFLDDSVPGIQHHFVRDLSLRFHRHLMWASIEAQELADNGSTVSTAHEILKGANQELEHYFVLRKGLQDGLPGLINGFMHFWKKIAMFCFLWEIQGSKPIAIANLDEIEQSMSALIELLNKLEYQ